MTPPPPGTVEPVGESFREILGDLGGTVPTLVLPILLYSIANSQIPSADFSIANSTLVLPRLTLRSPVLTLVLPVLL